MKPGNLRKRGAKSGGERQMRIRLKHTSGPPMCAFYLLEFFVCFCVMKG